MRNVLKRFGLARAGAIVPRASEPGGPFAPPKPDEILAVVGDVHGTRGAFERLLARISSDFPEARVILVGDLIDRGEESAAVLRHVFGSRNAIEVILGNHEEMLLRFLDSPEHEAARWLYNGGLQTLASFGIAAPGAEPRPEHCVTIRNQLREALGDKLEGWLRSLPRVLVSGNVAITHAGADPWQPISLQAEGALTWGAPDFGRRSRTDGLWVVHGHTIVAEARASDGIISIDTGAYAGGALSAAIISKGDVQFICEGP